MIRPVAMTLLVLAVLGMMALGTRSQRTDAARSTETRADISCQGHGESPVMVPAGMVLSGEDGSAMPGRAIPVGVFWIDRTEVTNREFGTFVKATGYVTTAEREGAGAVFRQPNALPRGYDDPSQWWALVPGADWRHPTGPSSDIAGQDDYPVVQLNFEDVEHYAKWRGGRLPTAAEWERAARGRQKSTRSPPSWAYAASGRPVANTWQGIFPISNAATDGHSGLAPVGCYPANEFGLYDMIGNVWEWTVARGSSDRARILKGGSHLCAMNYCANFRPAAWQEQEKDLPTSHIGFRLVYDRAHSSLGSPAPVH